MLSKNVFFSFYGFYGYGTYYYFAGGDYKTIEYISYLSSWLWDLSCWLWWSISNTWILDWLSICWSWNISRCRCICWCRYIWSILNWLSNRLCNVLLDRLNNWLNNRLCNNWLSNNLLNLLDWLVNNLSFNWIVFNSILESIDWNIFFKKLTTKNYL